VADKIIENGCQSRGNPNDGGFAFALIDSRVQEQLEADSKIKDGVFTGMSTKFGFNGVDPAGRKWEFDKVESEESSSTRPAEWLDRTGARTAQGAGLSGSGVSVYVMDSGVRVSHNEFGGRASGAVQSDGFVVDECRDGDTRCATDYNGHGTHVAGIVAGRNLGVAPKATILAMKPGPELFDLYMHMDWLGKNRKTPAVLSVSIGFNTAPPIAGGESAINALVARGVVIVVSAGNAGTDCSEFSFAAHGQAIAVGAVNAWNERSNSNFGKKVAIFAPGENINSASNQDNTDTSTSLWSGTSAATPQVSGAVALILQKDRSLSPAQVKEQLLAMSKRSVVPNGNSPLNNLLDVSPLATGPTTTTTTTCAPGTPWFMCR